MYDTAMGIFVLITVEAHLARMHKYNKVYEWTCDTTWYDRHCDHNVFSGLQNEYGDRIELHVQQNLWLATTPWCQQKRSLVAGGL